MPAPNPAMTVLGPVILPLSSCNSDLYASNATNPVLAHHTSQPSSLFSVKPGLKQCPQGSNLLRMPAFNEFPTISVVHPAYHCLPKGGQGNFFASGSCLLSWIRVFATDYCQS